MILADTSVWIDHFRKPDTRLATLLVDNLVRVHPWVLGELAMGNLANRAAILADLDALPRAVVASLAEVLALVDGEQLYGRGIGFVDAHLLASARLGGDLLWTTDRRLHQSAYQMNLAPTFRRSGPSS